MKANKSLIRKSHFLGTKIRNLRKRNNLTMDDLSTRCVRIDPEYAPSVSYLSMIERGKRVPSVEMLSVIADVFQKDVDWFLDDVAAEKDMITPNKGNRGGISGMPLEPSFLFSNDILQIAIPELLNQTGTSGRDFAHLLIRAHQEHHQNHFPDLERAAEEVGLKRMPLSVEELLIIVKQQGISIKWFDETPAEIIDELGVTTKNVTSSYFEAPNVLYLNRCLKNFPRRLKYELAVYIGRSILHSGSQTLTDNGGIAGGMSSTGINVGGVKYEELQRQSSKNASTKNQSSNSAVNAQDILNAWQDFESSFFAGALLCPKVPFRQLLDRHGYEVSVAAAADVSESVAMRRMTAVSPYSHWHYFDAYTPGKLKAVYRGNGIPLPWGNMRQVDDPCHHWAVFQMFDRTDLEIEGTSSQLSIMNVNGESRIYCCESKKVHDLAGNPHVICAGIDLNPALQAQGRDASAIAAELQAICADNGGEVPMTRNMTTNITKTQVNEPIFTTQTTPKKLSTDDISALRNIKKDLISVAKVLNINWVERSLERSAKLICSRGNVCPRKPGCYE
ncbi:DUF3612 domain-containing protein [Psychrosphaera ytuae]|uniref:DUF3612 domain-containing protein n=1 Tax=Psychrosphaera ytuae TaxID=2820710 RepID=UPI001E465276|nr:DUF3612 domain-containing protein [Psychrosphaera ytuae]